MALSKRTLTVIGDSTIDNTVWVENGRSVVTHLTEILPDFEVLDYSNDGFTTTDILNGAYRDKAFAPNQHTKFPHTLFQPLNEGAESIKKSAYVVVSVGGNNVREFMREILEIDDRVTLIKNKMPDLLQKLTKEYIEIINIISNLNPKAKIILMTQYYPSFIQNDYDIYPFMKLLGQALYASASPQGVIHRLVQNIYGDIFKHFSANPNVLVADVTSTLNPFNEYNHVKQIEPSDGGGEQIAALLRDIIHHDINEPHTLQRCFANLEQNGNLEFTASSMINWSPKHPRQFDQPGLQHEVIPIEISTTINEFKTLLDQINEASDTHQVDRPLYYLAGKRIVKEVECLLKKPFVDPINESAHLKQSLEASLAVLKNWDDTDAIDTLKITAKTIAPGKPQSWQLVIGVMLLLATVATAVISSALLVATAGLSATGYAGTLFFGALAIKSFSNGVKGSGLSNEMRGLAQTASLNKLS